MRNYSGGRCRCTTGGDPRGVFPLWASDRMSFSAYLIDAFSSVLHSLFHSHQPCLVVLHMSAGSPKSGAHQNALRRSQPSQQIMIKKHGYPRPPAMQSLQGVSHVHVCMDLARHSAWALMGRRRREGWVLLRMCAFGRRSGEKKERNDGFYSKYREATRGG